MTLLYSDLPLAPLTVRGWSPPRRLVGGEQSATLCSKVLLRTYSRGRHENHSSARTRKLQTTSYVISACLAFPGIVFIPAPGVGITQTNGPMSCSISRAAQTALSAGASR